MYSLVRHASARIVHVGFLSACDTNGPPSVTNRFLTSCAWHQRFSTDVFGSSPMRVPPSSWMIRPPAAIPYCSSAPGLAQSGVPPIAWMTAWKVSRSEEHTSELQSQSNLVCRLLLEKKKTN